MLYPPPVPDSAFPLSGVSKHLTSAQPAFGLVSPAPHQQRERTLPYYEAKDGAECGLPEMKLALWEGTNRHTGF